MASSDWITRRLVGEFLGFEASLFWLLVLLAMLSVMLGRTKFGDHMLAAGGDLDSAKSQGVQTDRTKTIAFVICSLLAGFAGIVTLADRPQTHVTL